MKSIMDDGALDYRVVWNPRVHTTWFVGPGHLRYVGNLSHEAALDLASRVGAILVLTETPPYPNIPPRQHA